MRTLPGPNLATIEPDILLGRITLLLNSVINLLCSYYGFAGTFPNIKSVDYGSPHTLAGGFFAAAAAYNITRNPHGACGEGQEYVVNTVNSGAPFVGASTEALVTQKNVIYKPDYTHVTILVVSALGLTITGLVGMIMGLRTRGPDVFDPLMGLTYNNCFLGLPSPRSTLDANTRANLLRAMRIQLGDVAGGESVGMVRVGRAPEVLPLAQGRLYE